MNIEKIKKGQIYKNYKELCETLGEKPKPTNSKQAQINHWSNYFEYHNEGHKWIIDKVYRKPRGKQTAKNGFINDVEELILDLLIQSENNGLLFLPKSKLFKSLNMVNGNYNLGRYQIPHINELTNIDKSEILEFYELSMSSIENSVVTALNKLQKKKLIFWNRSITVCQLNIDLPKNDSDYVISIKEDYDDSGNSTYDYKLENKVRKVHRKANTEEIRRIMDIERESLDEFQCNSESEVIAKFQWNAYKKSVNKKLNDSLNILYTYQSYEIIFNEEYIAKAWIDVKHYILEDYARKLKKSNINHSVSNKLKENTENRIQKALALKYQKEKVKDYRVQKEYLHNMKELIKLLIEWQQPILQELINNFNKK